MICVRILASPRGPIYGCHRGRDETGSLVLSRERESMTPWNCTASVTGMLILILKPTAGWALRYSMGNRFKGTYPCLSQSIRSGRFRLAAHVPTTWQHVHHVHQST